MATEERRGVMARDPVTITVLPAADVRLTVQDVDRCVEAGIAVLRRMPYRDYLRTAHWARQRTFAQERAGQRCELCGQGERLDVHHRSYAPGRLRAAR